MGRVETGVANGKYVERNPLQTEKEVIPKRRDPNKDRIFHGQNRKVHCLKVLTVASRREILKKNREIVQNVGRSTTHRYVTTRNRPLKRKKKEKTQLNSLSRRI